MAILAKLALVSLTVLLLEITVRAHAAESPHAKRPYPEARVAATRDTLHGVEVEDPYRWLESVDAAEVRAWTDAQNSFTRSTLDALPGRAAID